MDYPPSYDLVRDDLVVILHTPFPSPKGGGRVYLRDVLGRRDSYCLAVVKGSTSASSAFTHDNNSQQSITAMHGSLPPADSSRASWVCIPLVSLSSFLREWAAVQSMHHSQLMPLAPYILKASPVVSSQSLGAMNAAMAKKMNAVGEAYKAIQRNAGS